MWWRRNAIAIFIGCLASLFVAGDDNKEEPKEKSYTILKHRDTTDGRVWSAFVEIEYGSNDLYKTAQVGEKRVHIIPFFDDLHLKLYEHQYSGTSEGFTCLDLALVKGKEEYLKELGRPSHGAWGDSIYARDFWSEGEEKFYEQGDIQPFWGDFPVRDFEYDKYVLEIRILKCSVIHTKPGQPLAFKSVSLLATFSDKTKCYQSRNQ